MTDVSRIARLFSEAGFQWKFSDGRRVPNEDEIRKTIESCKVALADAEDNTQVEIGRLLVKKRDGFFDVFVLLGEYT